MAEKSLVQEFDKNCRRHLSRPKNLVRICLHKKPSMKQGNMANNTSSFHHSNSHPLKALLNFPNKCFIILWKFSPYFKNKDKRRFLGLILWSQFANRLKSEIKTDQIPVWNVWTCQLTLHHLIFSTPICIHTCRLKFQIFTENVSWFFL